MSDKETENWFKRLLNRFVIKPVKKMLLQGVSTKKIAFTMALAPVLGTFPVLGTTNFVCFTVGYLLKLNVPFLLLFKSLFYTLHLALILVFIRIGENLNGADHIPFSIPQLLGKFKDDPLLFAKEFGMTALYGIEAWALIMPWFLIPLYFIFKHFLLRFKKFRDENSSLKKEATSL